MHFSQSKKLPTRGICQGQCSPNMSSNEQCTPIPRASLPYHPSKLYELMAIANLQHRKCRGVLPREPFEVHLACKDITQEVLPTSMSVFENPNNRGDDLPQVLPWGACALPY